MNQEQREELAALHALDCLEGDELAQALRLCREDAGFNGLVIEFRQAAGQLGDLAPPVDPGPEFKQRLLKHISALPDPGPATVITSIGWKGWLGWVAALVMAMATGRMLVEREGGLTPEEERVAKVEETDSESSGSRALRDELDSVRVELERLRQQHDRLMAVMGEQLAEQASRLVQLEWSRRFDRTRLAHLEAQADAYEAATVSVIWCEITKRGVVQIEGLPTPVEGRDYQFWVVDQNGEEPVNAGMIQLDEDGCARIPFEPRRKVDDPGMFAISLEQAGGSSVNQGPIVLAGK